jgi:2-oxoglutarate dehydrogenase E2 component (dihydrolipoamide succinyltransferase)
MTIEIKVPMLPESVADALMLDWNKQVGDSVTRDEILVEVETDKVVLEVPAPEDGVLTEILVPAGETVLGEQVLARLEAGATPPQTPETSAKADVAEKESASVNTGADVQQDPEPAAETEIKESSPDSASTPGTGDAQTSPAVRRLAEESGLDLGAITGSGPGGRITKEDILKQLSRQAAPAGGSGSDSALSSTSSPPAEVAVEPTRSTPPVAAVEAAGVVERQESREPMSRLRQTIASRLVQSQQTAALLTTFNEVNMQPVMELRSRYKETFEKKHGAKLGFMSFFVKASTVALQRFPLVNAYIDGNDIVRHNYHDIGIAVSSPRGLLVPVLRNCESLSYAEIESLIQGFGARAREGKIAMEELVGGTFTITNGGVFGSLISTPIVNPPQSAILGMHKIQERPMAENGEVVIRPMMYLALSYDHRIVDGKEAVQFLVTVKEVLEDPARLLLDC